MTKTVLVLKNLQGLGLVGDGLYYITGNEWRARDLATEQHSCGRKTYQRGRAVDDRVFNLTGPGIEPQTSRTTNDVFPFTARFGRIGHIYQVADDSKSAKAHLASPSIAVEFSVNYVNN